MIKKFLFILLFLFCGTVVFSQKDTAWIAEAKVGDTVSLFQKDKKIVLKNLRFNQDSSKAFLDMDFLDNSDKLHPEITSGFASLVMTLKGYNIAGLPATFMPSCSFQVEFLKVIDKEKEMVQIKIREGDFCPHYYLQGRFEGLDGEAK